MTRLPQGPAPIAAFTSPSSTRCDAVALACVNLMIEGVPAPVIKR